MSAILQGKRPRQRTFQSLFSRKLWCFFLSFWFPSDSSVLDLLLSLSAIGIKWCETQRDCNRLRLMDILVKPMQRLTKYSLLLKAVHKKTDDEEHKPILIEMVRLSLLASVVVQATF